VAEEPGQEHAVPRLRACGPGALHSGSRQRGVRRMKPLLAFVVLALSACAAAPRSGGYYKDDGPGEKPPANLDQIADAQPKAEPLHRYANRPYQVFGKEYVPLAFVQPYRQRGVASWYGKKFHGQRTASGEPYDMYAMSAAHPTLPIPSYARGTRLTTGCSADPAGCDDDPAGCNDDRAGLGSARAGRGRLRAGGGVFVARQRRKPSLKVGRRIWLAQGHGPGARHRQPVAAARRAIPHAGRRALGGGAHREPAEHKAAARRALVRSYNSPFFHGHPCEA